MRGSAIPSAAWAVLALVIFVELLVGRERLSKEPAIADLTARGIRCALAASLKRADLLHTAARIAEKRL